MVTQYFTATGIARHFGPQRIPHDVESRVREELNRWDLKADPDFLEKYTQVGLEIGTKAYRHTSVDLQVDITIFTLAATLYDDAYMGYEAMSQMPHRFHTGQPQMHPTLQLCADTVLAMKRHFTDYSANVIVTSWLDFASAELLEVETKKMNITSGSAAFIEQLRMKTGVSEAYAAFIWPKDMFPNTTEYVQAIP